MKNTTSQSGQVGSAGASVGLGGGGGGEEGGVEGGVRESVEVRRVEGGGGGGDNGVGDGGVGDGGAGNGGEGEPGAGEGGVAEGGGFAGVSEAEALSMALTAGQRKAIEKLTAGSTLVEAATAAGVTRMTLHRWLNHEPEFMAAYAAWQRDLLATAQARLLAMAGAAVAGVMKGIQKGDGRLALRVLEKIGVAERMEMGTTDAKELKRKRDLEARREWVKRKKEEDQVRGDELLGM